MKNLGNLMYLLPIMVYYAIESFIIALFVSLLGRTILVDLLGGVSYLQWVAIIWIIKVVFFDVFKLITGLTGAGEQARRMEEQDYNESFEE